MTRLRIYIIVLFQFFSNACTGQVNSLDSESLALNDIPAELYGMPKILSVTDTSPAWHYKGQKLLVTGTVFQNDAQTPASNIVIYYYQTNTEGRYPQDPKQVRNMPPNSEGHSHGYIRGWVKTDANGRYFIYTTRPGTYPTRDQSAHIHLTILEPERENSYYIDDIQFDDDVLLSSKVRRSLENRGGSGIVRLVRNKNLAIAERDIILGLNVPGYQTTSTESLQSGLAIGEDLFSFTPYHAWGPDKGRSICPICKYGWFHGILYFVGKDPKWEEIKSWLNFLEKESETRKKYLKAYLIYGDSESYDKAERISRLEEIGRELNLRHIALTLVPSFKDKESDIYLNEINPEAKNTFLIYRRSRVIAKYINIPPSAENFDKIRQSMDRTVNEYFDLPKVN